MKNQYWAIRLERVGSLAADSILHFTIASTRKEAWLALFALHLFRDNPEAQRRAKRDFKAVKIEIREIGK